MIIGGYDGEPEQDRLTYVLPVRRTDHRTGLSLVARGFGLTATMRGFRPTEHRGNDVVQGVAGGGEDSVPEMRDDVSWSTVFNG